MESEQNTMTEGNKLEVAMEREEPDPYELGDWQYKEWLENQYLKELESERKK